MNELGAWTKRLSGGERFRLGEQALPFCVQQFWQWSSSNLIGNALRGVLAEYLVACALDCADRLRVEWDACDLCTPSGTRIEVKTSGYIQSWAQRVESKPSFDIAPKRAWDAESNTSLAEARRIADVYVFALHGHRDKATIDPLDLNQWEFHVVPTKVLENQCPGQKSIGLQRVRGLSGGAVGFAALASAIHKARDSRSNHALEPSARTVEN